MTDTKKEPQLQKSIAEQKGEEEQLRQTQLIVDNSHDAIIGETFDGIITSWNGGAERMFGYPAQEVIGKSVLLLVPSEMKEEVPTLMERVKSGEVIADYDSIRIHKNGSRINVALSASPIKTENGTIIGVSVVERDVSVRKTYESRIERMAKLYLALSKCNKAIVYSTDEKELFHQICTAVVESGGMTMAWVGLVDEESKQIKSVSSFGTGTEYLNGIQMSVNADDPFGRGPIGTAIRENRSVWCQDFKNDPMTALWHERAEKYGWSSSASLPLLRNGIPVGGLNFYSDTINAFDEDVQKLTMEMATDISFALGNFSNKAELKKSEESLRQTHLIVENSYDAIIGETLDGVITSWNGGAERMFGYSAEEVIGKSILFLVLPEMKDKVLEVFKKNKAGEVIADYDSAMVRRDGTRIDVAFSSSPIKTEEGTLIGVSCVERDITARKKEEELMRQTHLIVENSYDAIIGETLDGTITSWNGGAERMFGYSPKEMIGKSVSLLLPVEMKEEMPALLNKVKTGEVIADYDSVMLRKDGTRIDVAFSGSPIKREDGTVTGVSVVERDITIRKKGEQHIKELDQVRNKFITIISHQLGTPLTSVNWNLETLLNGDFGKMEETQHKFLQATHLASIEITNRIHSLLTAMDIEEGRVLYETGEVDLNSVCAAVVNERLKKCELKSLSCSYTPGSNDIPVIFGDGQKIRMAVSSLIENAINYSKDGGKISATLLVKNGMARFEVSDHGVGIPSAEQHLVFTRFFRASNASVMQQDAFGLGLFVAKNFIERHHGNIGFESKEGEGSTFWFEIPTK